MKTLQFLLLMAVILTFAAWITVEEASEARAVTSTVVPLAKSPQSSGHRNARL